MLSLRQEPTFCYFTDLCKEHILAAHKQAETLNHVSAVPSLETTNEPEEQLDLEGNIFEDEAVVYDLLQDAGLEEIPLDELEAELAALDASGTEDGIVNKSLEEIEKSLEMCRIDSSDDDMDDVQVKSDVTAQKDTFTRSDTIDFLSVDEGAAGPLHSCLRPGVPMSPGEDSPSMHVSYTLPVSQVPDEDAYTSFIETKSCPQEVSTQSLPGEYGLHKYLPPPLMCRRPPPASGRDDDLQKLREILDDTLLKLGYNSNLHSSSRVLCGPDNKICANLLKLIDQNPKYASFLPEFPLLHLRKSKINSLFSGYKDTGLLHLLKYMKDDSIAEWAKLISLEHIDIATRHVRRLSQALHIAFMAVFMATLSDKQFEEMEEELSTGPGLQCAAEYEELYKKFVQHGCQQNATFALHFDWMTHCDEVVALHMAERMGGRDGYQLLLAVVKSSLSFQFLNGASAYAPLCTRLIYEYYKAGIFHQNLKHSLFSTPIGNSTVNFATDAKREMEHISAIKLLRSGSTEASVIRRMSLIDSLTAVSKHQASMRSFNEVVEAPERDLEWSFPETDLKYITRTANLILRRGALNSDTCDVPLNVYTHEVTVLSAGILDHNTQQVGEYLITRFAAAQGLFGMTESDLPDIEKVNAPKDLLVRLKRSKGTTMKRGQKKVNVVHKTERQAKEEKRKKIVARKAKDVDSFSSEMNNCQALVKPDCSKPKVMKAQGMKKAIMKMMVDLQKNKCGEQSSDIINKLILLELTKLPNEIVDTIAIATVEFAGVKFKSKVSSGMHYLRHVEASVLKPIVHQLPRMKRLVICEEKYSFTPDDFKAATREQRQTKDRGSIAHLKTVDEMISDKAFNKEAVVTTAEGKCLISKYLAANMKKVNIRKDIIIDVDSELNIEGCTCVAQQGICECPKHAVPLRCSFTTAGGFEHAVPLNDMKQRKGEAELAQVDWLLDAANSLAPGEAAISVVTSGDIDAIPIHLFVLSLRWPRNTDGSFIFPVYVLLQKPNKKQDLYNITGMVEILEKSFQEKYIAVKIAVGLCMGGNDFVPKFYGKSHDKILSLLLMNDTFKQGLISVDPPTVGLNTPVYVEFVKALYCAPKMDAQSVPFDQVRKMSMKKSAQRAVIKIYSFQALVNKSDHLNSGFLLLVFSNMLLKLLLCR